MVETDGQLDDDESDHSGRADARGADSRGLRRLPGPIVGKAVAVDVDDVPDAQRLDLALRGLVSLVSHDVVGFPQRAGIDTTHRNANRPKGLKRRISRGATNHRTNR